jgi:dihydroxyacetone kinase DhaKLM complex PTS-EIIA-like component DhaM
MTGRRDLLQEISDQFDSEVSRAIAREASGDPVLALVDLRLAALRAEPEAEMKTTTGIGIRRAIHELEELRADLAPI